jgi:hypothetical protein
MAKDKQELSGYDLSRSFFDWCFTNPDMVRPNHVALYFFCIEHCNRLGWKDKFGLPTTMTMEAIGIKSYNTYSNTLSDLVSWGFIRLVEKSKNQYSANIIALSKFNKAINKALDKAFIKHRLKQSESTGESIDSIDKQVNNKPINKEPIEERKQKFAQTLEPFLSEFGREILNEFYKYWTEPNQKKTKLKFEMQKTWDAKRRLDTWKKNELKFNKNGKSETNNAELDQLSEIARQQLNGSLNP